MSEEKKSRKPFPEWIVEVVFHEQDGVCGNPKCFNPLAAGFHRHHKDKDNTNNSKINCQLLCLECHFATFEGPNKDESKNPLKEHRKLQTILMAKLGKAISAALDKTITGSTLERILAGISQHESMSWKEKGISLQVEYTPSIFTMLRHMQKDGIIQESYLEGFKLGVLEGTKIAKSK